ncbi:MAG TPA: AI-2E family transporter [Chloroflexota bacterium]|nr:AI-2E family transporter [Chloroflexota bacterium]
MRTVRRHQVKPLTPKAAWHVAARVVFLTFGVLFAIWLLLQLGRVLVLLILALIVSAAMTPVVTRLQRPIPFFGGRSWTPPRAVIALGLYAVLLAMLVGAGTLFIPPLVSDTRNVIESLPQRMEAIQESLNELSQRSPFIPSPELVESMGLNAGGGVEQFTSLLGGALGGLLNAVQIALDIVGAFFALLLVLVLAVWLTSASLGVRQYFLEFLPERRQPRVARLTSRIGERLGGWLRGQIALSAIVGALTLVGLWAIGVPAAVLLAVIAAIGEAIPIVGPILSAIPAILVAAAVSPGTALLTAGLFAVIQQLENNLIVPKVMGKAVAIHPLAVMVALLVGSELYGVLGAILSVPIAAALAVIVNAIREDIREEDTERREKRARQLRPWRGRGHGHGRAVSIGVKPQEALSSPPAPPTTPDQTRAA